MRDSAVVSLASYKLAPDLDKYPTGAAAYDAPARRRDVVEAIRVIEMLRPRIQWRELLPSYGSGDDLRIDGRAIPFWILRWVATICGSLVSIGLTIKLWQWVLA